MGDTVRITYNPGKGQTEVVITPPDSNQGDPEIYIFEGDVDIEVTDAEVRTKPKK